MERSSESASGIPPSGSASSIVSLSFSSKAPAHEKKRGAPCASTGNGGERMASLASSVCAVTSSWTFPGFSARASNQSIRTSPRLGIATQAKPSPCSTSSPPVKVAFPRSTGPVAFQEIFVFFPFSR